MTPPDPRAGAAQAAAAAGTAGRGSREADVGPILAMLERVEGLAARPALVDKVRRHLDQLPPVERLALTDRLAELSPGGEAWSSLVEALVNHETYFLRDGAQFELLGRLLPDLLARAAASGRTVLRAWSAGCATGEEAYSIALVLAEGLLREGKAVRFGGGIELLAPWRVEVVGSDLSRRAIAVAEAARYPVQELSSFRQVTDACLAFFPPVPDSGGRMRRVHPCLRELARFERRNIARSPPPPGRFDVVACRNVLVYLTADARAAAVAALADALEPGGCLLVGPTDLASDTGRTEVVWSDRAIIHRRRPDPAGTPAGSRAG